MQGPGNGRDTRLYAENCTGRVFGVDISVAIDSAYSHLKSYPNAHLIQADLTLLPFPRVTSTSLLAIRCYTTHATCDAGISV